MTKPDKTTEIVPSESESYKCATAIYAEFPCARQGGSFDARKQVSRTKAIVELFTHYEGRTAEYWAEAWRQSGLTFDSLVDVIYAQNDVVKSLQAKLTAAEESLKAIVDEDPFDSCRATRIAKAYLASRNSGRPMEE